MKPAETVNVFEGFTNKLDIKLQKSCSRRKQRRRRRWKRRKIVEMKSIDSTEGH